MLQNQPEIFDESFLDAENSTKIQKGQGSTATLRDFFYFNFLNFALKIAPKSSCYTATLIILNFLIKKPPQKLNFQHAVTHKLTQTQLCFISYIYHTPTHGKYPLQKHASVKIILSVGEKVHRSCIETKHNHNGFFNAHFLLSTNSETLSSV